MSVYYGVVKNRQVVLEADAPLVEGQRVEVRPVGDEKMVQELLRAEGLLTDEPADAVPPSDPTFTPIEVRGQLLSEQIIAERR